MDYTCDAEKRVAGNMKRQKKPQEHNEIKKNAKEPRKRHKKSEKNTRKLKKRKEFEKV